MFDKHRNLGGRPPKPVEEKYIRVLITLPPDVARWLDCQENKSQYISELIRRDIKMKTKKTMREIVQLIVENGRVKTQVELVNEFEFEAQEQGWTDKEIQEAIQSPWFPTL